MPFTFSIVALSALLAPPPSADSIGQRWRYASDGMAFTVEVVTTEIRVPVGIALLPDGRLLVADRFFGRLYAVDPKSGAKTVLEGLTQVLADSSEAGLLDVVLHPDYRTNGWIYLAYSFDRPGGTTTVVDRARLAGNRLTDIERLFEARPIVSGSEHYGGRLALQNGFLYLTLGDRNTRDQAQYLGNHHGKVIRLRDDGKIPADNPFVGRDDALPEIWSWGHRNPQGLAVHPATGELWANEHGPRGGDEVNVIRPGANYGWPLITYGQEYYGVPVGKGLTRRDGLEQPQHYWVPGIAPSGLTFYSGDKFPAWRGNLLSGAMSRTHLNRLVFDNGRVVKEERLLSDRGWRVRAVVQGPDGFLYLGVDGGMVLRIRPN
ncbi:MAG: PQQ-dependent sugar dehydrogenase [Gemmatimonadales bacterium]|nr:PQQ-dependent sugar dehydrogenase [Gemmatimonadales bacterium]